VFEGRGEDAEEVSRYILGVLTVIFSSTVAAQTHLFSCSGVTTGKTILDSRNAFDVRIELSPPNLISPAGRLNFCSFLFNEKNEVNLKTSCMLRDTELVCECSGGDYVKSSVHKFSRLSGRLTFIAILSDDVYHGDYQCRRAEKKLF